MASLRAFYNVCQHRAHELVSGEGNCKVLVCPYHAWSYELSGELRSGPNIKVREGFDKREICLSEVRIENFHGFIFANLDPDARPMDEWFPGCASNWPDFVPHIARLKPLEWVEIPEKLQLEGFGRELFGVLSLLAQPSDLRHRRDQVADLRHPATRALPAPHHRVRQSRPDELPDRPCLKPHAGDYSSWFLWPMFSFQVYPGNVLNTYHWREHVDADQCTVWRGWYTIDGVDSDVIRRLAIQDRATTVEEDIRSSNRCSAD
jgi:nitrite reductase/ring-hydroxylating ferredoxin subunit